MPKRLPDNLALATGHVVGVAMPSSTLLAMASNLPVRRTAGSNSDPHAPRTPGNSSGIGGPVGRSSSAGIPGVPRP